MGGVKFGGADGIRTHDLLDAIEARSQLRHGPTDGLIHVSTTLIVKLRVGQCRVSLRGLDEKVLQDEITQNFRHLFPTNETVTSPVWVSIFSLQAALASMVFVTISVQYFPRSSMAMLLLPAP